VDDRFPIGHRLLKAATPIPWALLPIIATLDDHEFADGATRTFRTVKLGGPGSGEEGNAPPRDPRSQRLTGAAPPSGRS
jgi:hypothetical protein